MSNYSPMGRVSEPKGPRQRKPIFVRLFGRWLLWTVLLSVAAFAAASWGYITFTAPGPLTTKKIVQVAKPIDRGMISATLLEQGIIADARVFSAAAAASDYRGSHIKPGEYEFNPNQSMEEVLNILTRGQVLTYKVTIPEGWTSEMVVARLNEQDQLSGSITAVPAEGTLLPETYVLPRGYDREKLLGDMAAAQAKFLDLQWPRLSPTSPIKSKADLVTMASIVEKETGVAEERSQVAAVFINRLNQKMRLQSDPTVIYGVAPGKGKIDHALTRTELETATPYNTYTNDGLPPAPIANPGKAAIEAVLNPATENYLYFVADGTGGHAFAATLEDHNANVKKWRALNGLPDQAAPVKVDTTQPAAIPAASGLPEPQAPTPTVPVEVKPKIPAKPGSTVVINGKKVPIPRLKKPKK